MSLYYCELITIHTSLVVTLLIRRPHLGGTDCWLTQKKIDNSQHLDSINTMDGAGNNVHTHTILYDRQKENRSQMRSYYSTCLLHLLHHRQYHRGKDRGTGRSPPARTALLKPKYSRRPWPLSIGVHAFVEDLWATH
ncbi:unnamed protein product [Ectocarpus sp. 6 AP-2014]